MIAFKGFNQDLSCTMGNGTFQYEVGKTYTENKAKCASTGFHCVEEPIEVLSWYLNGRYCIVDAKGDIHEDGKDKISCSEIMLLKEISLVELGMLECKWLQNHPDRKYSSNVCRDEGYERGENRIVIVRGKHPKAAGAIGVTMFLLKENPHSRNIEEIAVYQVDGEEFLPGVYYRTDGKKAKK